MLQPDYTEQTTRQPERMVQAALDALSAHIAILDETGTIIGVNAAWRRFADSNDYRDTSYGVGTNYLAVCDHASGRYSRESPMVARGIRDVINRETEEFRLEYPCHSPWEKRWFVMHVTRFAWNGHQRIVVAHQNVTELKSVQVELSESQRRIQTILDNVINGIITLDANGAIESINLAGAAIFGYTIEELTGQPMTMLLSDQYQEKASQLMHQLQTTTDHERIGRRSDGSLFPIYFAISRVTIGNRRIFTGVIQDITDRKQVEGERLEKERLSIELQKEREMREIKNRFISMMSHELRTPLASIMLSNDMLKRYGEQAPPEEKLLYFNNISTQVALLTDLIRDVSTISRSDTQSQTLMPERANIVEYCRDIVDEFRLTYEESHALIFSSPATEIYATIDTKVMRQVLSNLVSNAIKYTPEGGEIIVYVSNGGRYAKVRVSDNGIGIPQDDQKYLFQPFHRASNVDTLPGTGLGLSIAKQAVELHNGTISIESQVGVGTSITVNLPIDLSGEY